jgi:hypothetical protein
MISLTNEHTRCRTYLGGGVYRVGMGAVGPGAALKANLIVEFFFGLFITLQVAKTARWQKLLAANNL